MSFVVPKFQGKMHQRILQQTFKIKYLSVFFIASSAAKALKFKIYNNEWNCSSQ
jgi:hypothetical protein